MIGSLVFLISITFAQSSSKNPTNESSEKLNLPPPTSRSPVKLKHYSETHYVHELWGVATVARFRVEKKLDFNSTVPVIAFGGVLIDRNLIITDGKKVSGNAASPHAGVKSELYPDVWTWAEYRQKYWEATATAPSKNAVDARLGIAFEREFAPIFSNWLIPEAMFEFVQIQRLSMDLYGEYNFVSFPTKAIDTRNQLRAGIRGGVRLKNVSASMMIFQPYLETAPSRYEIRGPEMMTYLSASL